MQEQIEKFKERYPRAGNFTSDVNTVFVDGMINFPEKYAAESENRAYIFDALKNKYLADSHSNSSSSELVYNFHYFPEELQTFTPEETMQTLDKMGSYEFNQFESQLFVASLPLENRHYKKMYDKYNYYDYDSEVPYSKKSLLDLFRKNNNRNNQWTYIPFFKYKDFNLETLERIEIFRDLVENVDGGNSHKFLIKVLSQFDEIFEDIELSEIETSMDILIRKAGEYSGAKEFHTLTVLSERHDMLPEYKEKITTVFAATSSQRILKSLFAPEAGTVLSVEEIRLKSNSQMMEKLELQFYEKGEETDLRHFFFEVLDGKKEAVDKEKLILAYARKIYELKTEEFIDLFIIGKKLDRQYAQFFMPKVKALNHEFFNQIKEKLRLSQMTREEYDWVVRETVKFGALDLSVFALEGQYSGDTALDVAEKQELFRQFMQNATNKQNTIDAINYKIEKLVQTMVGKEDRTMFLREFFNEVIRHDKYHGLISNRVLEIQDVFSEKTEQREYFNKFLKSTNAKVVADNLISISNLDVNTSKSASKNIFSLIDEEQRKEFLDHALTFDSLKVESIYMRFLGNLSVNERNAFLEKILAKNDIFAEAADEEIVSFCLSTIDRGNESLLSGNVEKIFSKIFSSANMKGQALLALGENAQGKEFLIKNKIIFGQYIEKCTSVKDINGLSVLKNFRPTAENERILDVEQIKALSVKLLDEIYMNPEIYSFYLESTPGTPLFYLDKKLFNKSVQRIVESKESASNIDNKQTIDFLVLQRENKKKRKDIIACSNIQEKKVVERLFASSTPLKKDRYEEIWLLDQKLFTFGLTENMQKQKINTDGISALLQTEKGVFFNSSLDVIDYCFSPKISTKEVFVLLCDRYKDDPMLLKSIKNKVYGLKEVGLKEQLKMRLLSEDLLEAEELKEIYEEARSQENIRAQVLSSAEILGSLVSAERMDGIQKFFTENNREAEKNTMEIVSFVQKYPLEKKGRTITVMLFAQEYLPERKTEEIIEKVATRLRKYERVLEKFKYEGIPEGLHTSLGLEYEITSSTADGYSKLTERDLKTDIARLSEAAHIGSGRDAVHEIATRPVVNPYLLILEMQILHDIEYIDFNFDRSPEYQKGARGYHLTLGGEEGLFVNANTHFLQNALLAASWGGIHAGETGKKVSGGRGVTVRGRSAEGDHNVKVFDKATPSVELRSLSIDKMEPFQRSVVTAYHGAIAIQALEKYTTIPSDSLAKFLETENPKTEEDFFKLLEANGHMKTGISVSDPKVKKIVYAWAKLTKKIQESIVYHNEYFLNGETGGYMNKQDEWIDTNDFGGQYNMRRFESVVESIDSTLSLEEYVGTTKIEFNDLFSSFDQELADSLTKINNLYLKPSNKGDQANAISMLETTKLDNRRLERRDEPVYVEGTVFDTLGERREGYYNVQGGSERMITHAVQKALLEFNREMEEIVN